MAEEVDKEALSDDVAETVKKAEEYEVVTKEMRKPKRL